MTFPDDFLRLNLDTGSINLPLKEFGLEWPPPQKLYVDYDGTLREAKKTDIQAYVMVQIRCSEITDEERAEKTHVVRGAEYEYLQKGRKYKT